MNEQDFRDNLKWFQKSFPAAYGTICEPEFLRHWFDTFFCHLASDDVSQGRLAMIELEVIPHHERFMSQWYKLSKRAESRRIEREAKAANWRATRTAVREILEGDGVLAKVYRESLEIPSDQKDEWFKRKWKELDDAGIKY